VEVDLEVNLGDIRFAISGKKMKNGIEKDRCPEDIFLASGLQPSSDGKICRVKTYMRVLPEYDGCVCCGGIPEGKAAINIIPDIPPTLGAADPGQFGWEPMDVNQIEFEL
jgi:hypothetical protein